MSLGKFTPILMGFSILTSSARFITSVSSTLGHILIGPNKDFLEFLHQRYKLIFHVLGKVYPDLDGFFFLSFLS